ncbi:hypothetical protein H6F93_30905 [Leptolyngbya sp. FACHB-671]|uniref:hypothetical protein n=1 Tax=Leptolyngbya sp. FACHB-671 TaxID=2692812 RepID=UPI00168755A8|nr:hypothetical protein [Leptolyngbya sp. FACHB-671]MBD2071880.1 hypothetical protein [Leptolyngbya sp. FACHB-671]
MLQSCTPQPLNLSIPSASITSANQMTVHPLNEEEACEDRLRQLIFAVQQNPRSSLTWRRAMNQLLLEIQQLPGLAKSNHPDYPEALNDTFLRLADEIHEFEPQQASLQRSLIAWINGKLRLKYRIKDLVTPQRPPRTKTQNPKIEFQRQAQKTPISIDKPLSEDASTTFADQLVAPGACTILELEEEVRQAQAAQQRNRIGLQLAEYIETDPEEKLRQCHPQAYPACNCQMLSQRLLLKHPPDRMVQLAREFEINYHTLNWHWKNRGLPLLQTIAQNLGYQPDKDIEI